MDYFALFGLPLTYQQDSTEIKQRYLSLQRTMHPDNYTDATPAEKQLALSHTARINDAYQTLKDPLKRAIYLLKLAGYDTQSEQDTSMPMDFLMAQMSLREQLAELAREPRNESDLAMLKSEIAHSLTEHEQAISEHLTLENQAFEQARLCVRKMQFYVRLQEEITNLTD